MKESQVLHCILWMKNKKNSFTNIIKNNDNNNNDDDDDDKVFQKMCPNISFKTYFQNRIMECKRGMKASVENVYFIQNARNLDKIYLFRDLES